MLPGVFRRSQWVSEALLKVFREFQGHSRHFLEGFRYRGVTGVYRGVKGVSGGFKVFYLGFRDVLVVFYGT